MDLKYDNNELKKIYYCVLDVSDNYVSFWTSQPTPPCLGRGGGGGVFGQETTPPPANSFEDYVDYCILRYKKKLIIYIYADNHD